MLWSWEQLSQKSVADADSICQEEALRQLPSMSWFGASLKK
jgi:hypothetical protein